MADLSTIEKNLQAQYDKIYNPQIAASNSDYDQQINATNSNYKQQGNTLDTTYNNTLSQENQKKAAIPGQYQGARESAYLNLQKANEALPEQLSNMGYSPDSGLAYSSKVANNAAWQKSVDTANKSQDTAIQNEDNTIGTLGVNYNNSKNKLAADLASAIQSLQGQKTQAQQKLQSAESAAVLSAAQTQLANEEANDAKVQAARITAAANASGSSGSSSGGSKTTSGSGGSSAKSPTASEINSARSSLINQYAPKGKLVSNASYQQLYRAIDSLPWPDPAKFSLLDTIPAIDPISKKRTSFGQAYINFTNPNTVSGYNIKNMLSWPRPR